LAADFGISAGGSADFELAALDFHFGFGTAWLCMVIRGCREGDSWLQRGKVFCGCSKGTLHPRLLCILWLQQQYFEVAVRLVAAAAVFRGCCASGGSSNNISRLLCIWCMAAATVFRGCCASGGSSNSISRLLCVWWQQRQCFQSYVAEQDGSKGRVFFGNAEYSFGCSASSPELQVVFGCSTSSLRALQSVYLAATSLFRVAVGLFRAAAGLFGVAVYSFKAAVYSFKAAVSSIWNCNGGCNGSSNNICSVRI